MKFAFVCNEDELEEAIKKIIQDRIDKYEYERKIIKHTPGEKLIFVEMHFKEKKKEILHD